MFQNLDIHFHVTPALGYFPTFSSLSLLGDASGLFLSDLYALAHFIAKSVLSENAAQQDCKSQCCVKVLDYFRLAFCYDEGFTDSVTL